MRWIFYLMIIASVSCSFDDEIERAASICDEKIRTVFEEYEEKYGYECLTKEEILDYLDEYLGESDDVVSPVAVRVSPHYSYARSKYYGVHDAHLKMCLPLKDFYRSERFPL